VQIDWDVPITVDDGLVLRADVFRPPAPGRYPVLLTYGPYGKWLHFEDLYTYEYPGGPAAGLGTLGAVFTGVGPFRHDDARDRPPAIFGGQVSVHCGSKRPSHVLLPIIPPKRG
jgi:hypothetical protein